MNYDKYIFLDYENIRDININIFNKKVKVIVIFEKNESKTPLDLLKKVQPFGNSIDWIQIEKYENGIASKYLLFLGYYILNQGNKEFIIYSKNKDYDHLIEHLKNKNINLIRIENLRQLNENTKNSLFNNPLGYISVLWNKLALIQKIFIICIILAVIASLVKLHTFTY